MLPKHHHQCGGEPNIQMPEAMGGVNLKHHIQVYNFRLSLQMKEKWTLKKIQPNILLGKNRKS